MTGAKAAFLTGTVFDNGGKPLAAARVTIFNEARKRNEAMYLAADGSYAIHTDWRQLDIRARRANFQDAVVAVQVGADRLRIANFTFASAGSFGCIVGRRAQCQIALGDTAQRQLSVSPCQYCHQMGIASTRTPRTSFILIALSAVPRHLLPLALAWVK